MENCVTCAGDLMSLSLWGSDTKDVSIQVRQNTTVGDCLVLGIDQSQMPSGETPIRVDFSANVTNCAGPGHRAVLRFDQVNLEPFLSAQGAEELLRAVVALHEQHNVYAAGTRMLHHGQISKSGFSHLAASQGKDLADWNRFWTQTDTGSTEGVVRFQGGDVFQRTLTNPQKITPDDFRLRPDSPGYRAGPDGKDLGADVDLVGPGPAYERWKKTPEYQQWLNGTGQLRQRGAAKPETGAFVVLGGIGVAELKFDTLAEAVKSARFGDTIEIRGNGPFPTAQVNIQNQSLVIRAGAGFQPVIRTSDPTGCALSLTDTRVVAEGLEFQLLASDDNAITPGIIDYAGGAVHLANCRLVARPWGFVVRSGQAEATCVLRNCELLTAHAPVVITGLATNGRLGIDNCVLAGGGVFAMACRPGPRKLSLSLRHSTVVTSTLLTLRMDDIENVLADKTALVPIQLESVSNVIAGLDSMWLGHQADLALTEPEAAALVPNLARLVSWRQHQNLYATKHRFHPRVAKDVAEWDGYWGSNNSGNRQGPISFLGGDLLSKRTDGELTAADFRLVPPANSVSTGADSNGLGADVGLVGPGAAYERWKKTREYQQWLIVTKQEAKAEAANPESYAAHRELAKWQGEWENAAYGRLVISGERWSSYPKGGQEVLSTIKIVEVTDEMTYILLLNGGIDGKVRTIQTILRVDGDTLHNCGTIGSVRPTEFANKPGFIYTQWKRVTTPHP
jgi:hypothetical protein